MNIIIGFLLFLTGGFIGVATMCLVQINRFSENLSTEFEKNGKKKIGN